VAYSHAKTKLWFPNKNFTIKALHILETGENRELRA
jgi:hypothetical protein